jgi:hypothetical protein
MDDVTIKTNKPNEDEIKFRKLPQKKELNSEIANVSIFDETLKEIDQTLTHLEQKLEIEQEPLEEVNVLPQVKSAISKINIAKNVLTKEENNLIKNNNLLKRIEDVEENINNLKKQISLSGELKKETISEIKDHEIDKNLLSIEELHAFEKNDEKKEKILFGFYGYLILTIVIFLTFYGALKILNESIILKYPILEPYINYFFEVIKILEVTIFGLLNYIKNIV